MIDYNEYKVVSFDIFDTLVIRNVNSPYDVFELVEKKYNETHLKKINDFKVNRMKAERICRLNSQFEEITFDEIYSELEKYYTNSELKELSKLEIEIEKMVCFPNNDMKSEFDNLKGKVKIIITSDMYLDEKNIKDILRNCGYDGYDKLYLSSKLKKTKNKSSIFGLILKDLNIKSNEMLHVGDNEKSDYINPKKYGINSILYKKVYHNKYENKYNNTIVNSLIKNHNSKDYFELFGYSILGPLLFDFTEWLIYDLNKKSKKDIHFFARDGFLMKKAFDIISGDQIRTNYFYTSRRSLLVPTFIKYKSIDDIFDNIQIDRTYKKLKKRIGLEDIDISEYEKKYSITDDTRISYEILKEDLNIRSFFEEIFSIIKENSLNEYNCFIEYINSVGFNSNSSIVDIGWYGNMQKYLSNILEYDVSGYYLGLFPNGEIQKKLNMQGFLFDTNHGNDIYNFEKSINAIIELLFTAPHGSVNKYSSNGKVVLYEYEYENDDNYKKIEILQDGAIDFINDYVKYSKYFNFDYLDNYKECLKEFALDPTYEDAINWGNFLFFDNGSEYIAKSNSKSYYLFHPKMFIYDFKKSYWKIGFLKQNFKFLIPIYRVLKVGRCK